MITKEKNKIDKAFKNFNLVYNSGNIKFSTLDNWLEKESNIFVNEINYTTSFYKKFKRGQIIKVDFGINIGSELCYTHFAIVVTNNDSINSDILTVIPITSKRGNCRVPLGKLLHKSFPNSIKYNLNCYANLTQITSISKKRIFNSKKEYICDNDILNKIDTSLMVLYTKKIKSK